MKTSISLLLCLTLTLFSNAALAECDFSTGITPGPNKTFIYSEACHLKVGQLVQDNQVKAQQITDLTKAIQLKDLAIQASDSRVVLWQNTSDQLQDRMSKIDELKSKNNWLYFGLGVLTVVATGYGVAKLTGH